MNILMENTVEIRFKANPKILDHRGDWASAISDHMNLEDWRVSDHQIDIYNKDETEHAFLSFKSCGYVTINQAIKGFFRDRATSFIKFLFHENVFQGEKLFVQRLGVRSKICTEYEGSFEELVANCSSRYITLTSGAKEVFSGKLVDIGAPLHFKDTYGNYNTMCGPMKEDQIKRHFEKAENVPKVGLFIDIDCWTVPKKNISLRDIAKNIKGFADSSDDRLAKARKLIVGA